MLRTEFAFELPTGYLDDHGGLHRQGIMRLAMAMDEVEPLQDVRVRSNGGFAGILLLSRVVTSLGTFSPVPAEVIARLFLDDYSFLLRLYRRINGMDGADEVETQCPRCAHQFFLDKDMLQEAIGGDSIL